MEFHRGRLVDHVHLRVNDLEASKRFYRAVLSAIGLADAFVEGKGHFYADELFVDMSDDYVSRIHLAFQAPNRETVHAFHRAAIAAGGPRQWSPRRAALPPWLLRRLRARSRRQQYRGCFSRACEPFGNVGRADANRGVDT